MQPHVRTVLVVLAVSAAPSPAFAQQCPGSPGVQAVCKRAIDALKMLHPAVGLIVSGGDPALGSARALGGFGHFFITGRVNAVNVRAPSPDTTFGLVTIHDFVPAPVVEAGVGVWPGFQNGL